MPRVEITVPKENEVVTSGQPFTVAGAVFTRGMPEPITIDSVAVRVDGDPPVNAQLKSNPPKLAIVNYSAQDTATGPVGTSRVLLVKAIDELGISGSAAVTIFVDQGPLDATFNGTATLTTTFSMAPGPFVEQVSIGLQFSADRKTVSITNFPSIPFSSSSPGGVTVKGTVSRASGGLGTFDPSTGTLIMPVTLSFQFVAAVFGIPFHSGTPTLALVLSTAPPAGSPMKADGSITVAGSGTFLGDVLNGSTGTLVISGVVSPHP